MNCFGSCIRTKNNLLSTVYSVKSQKVGQADIAQPILLLAYSADAHNQHCILCDFDFVFINLPETIYKPFFLIFFETDVISVLTHTYIIQVYMKASISILPNLNLCWASWGPVYGSSFCRPSGKYMSNLNTIWLKAGSTVCLIVSMQMIFKSIKGEHFS